jgi:uncharacterized protein YoaH (UPF0181 family)
MIDKIDITQPLMEPGASSGQANLPRVHPQNNADVSVQVDYASLIEQAMEQQQADAQAVERARQLLLSGQLESPLNIKEAAENIVKFGI